MKSDFSHKPFIKKFFDSGFFYVYDVNTNRIVEVEKPVYDIIDEYEELNFEGLECGYKEAHRFSDYKRSIESIEIDRREHGLFLSFRPEKVTHGIRSTDDVIKLHEKGLNQIILEITNRCNLNCAYCSVSGKYTATGYSRGHMSRETCRKAVDFFCERISDSGYHFISFYGGEPLYGSIC